MQAKVGVQYPLARKLLQGRLKKERFIGGNGNDEVAITSFPGGKKKGLKSEAGEGLRSEFLQECSHLQLIQTRHIIKSVKVKTTVQTKFTKTRHFKPLGPGLRLQLKPRPRVSAPSVPHVSRGSSTAVSTAPRAAQPALSCAGPTARHDLAHFRNNGNGSECRGGGGKAQRHPLFFREMVLMRFLD